MPTAIALSFPWGSYHANPWGRHVNEAVVEWPPSPWRLLRALYSVWKCREPDLPAEVVEDLLASLAVLPSFVLPPSIDAHTRHYLPDSRGGTDKGVDAFTVVEHDASVGVTWPVELDERARRTLSVLLASLPYLGRAESICEASLLEPGQQLPPGQACGPVTAGEAAEGGSVRVLAPRSPLDVKALVARPLEVRRAGLVEPPGSYWQAYSLAPRRVPQGRPADLHRRPPSGPPNAVRWALHAPALPSISAALAMTDILRRACMSKIGDPPSDVVAGKDAAGDPLKGHRHAHYLAFDDVGLRRLTHLVVWAPAGLGRREVAALARLAELRAHEHVSDFRPARLGLEAVGDISAVAPRLVGPAARWVSHTPFAPPRHGRRGVMWESHVMAQVAQELARRGHPEPVSIRVLTGDWLSFRRHRTSERLADGRRAVGVEIQFAERVTGPIALGALSHFGLGLFVPER